jgi:hypothetical protein
MGRTSTAPNILLQGRVKKKYTRRQGSLGIPELSN